MITFLFSLHRPPTLEHEQWKLLHNIKTKTEAKTNTEEKAKTKDFSLLPPQNTNTRTRTVETIAYYVLKTKTKTETGAKKRFFFSSLERPPTLGRTRTVDTVI